MVNFMLKNKLLLAALIVGALLRLWHLNSNPPHLNSDEAALGYNAYSILTTARDEHGSFLPVIFKSFGDWKPGLYVYLTVPFVAIMGLNEWAVRLPSAISGILAIWLLYLVVLKLFKDKNMASISALVLALTPWHIHFSRGAWEANVALTLILAGIYYFLEFVEGKRNKLIFSVLFFALTFWTYQGAKLSTALVVLSLIACNLKVVLKNKEHVAKAAVFGLIITLPIFLSFFQGKAGRLEVFSVFSYVRPKAAIEEILRQDKNGNLGIEFYLYHTEPLSFVRGILGRWLNHYSADFLFFKGDENPRHHATDTGMLLLVQAPLLALGFLGLFKSKRTGVAFILLWLILAPLPASLSRDSSHAVRSYQLVIPISVLAAFGVLQLAELIKKSKLKHTILCALTFGLAGNYLYYLDQYHVHYPVHDSGAWAYGYKEAVQVVTRSEDEFDNIIFQPSYNQPYIFFLFHQKYDPKRFQDVAKTSFEASLYGDVGKTAKLGKIQFRDATEGDIQKPKTMIVYDPETPPFPAIFDLKDAQAQDIKRLNGTTAFRVLKIQ